MNLRRRRLQALALFALLLTAPAATAPNHTAGREALLPGVLKAES